MTNTHATSPEDLTEEEIINMLGALKKEYRVDISLDTFYEAAISDLAFLQSRKISQNEKDALEAIHWFSKGIKPREQSHIPSRILERVAFLYACRKDFPALEELVKRDQGLPSSLNMHLITYYARYGHLEKVEEILDQSGERISMRDKEHAVMEAAKYGHRGIVKELLTAQGMEKHAGSALGIAASHGQVAVIKMVLGRFGAKISAPDKDEALERAAEKGHLEAVKELLDRCSQEISKGSKGKAALAAAKAGALEVAYELRDRYAGEMPFQLRNKVESELCRQEEALAQRLAEEAVAQQKAPVHRDYFKEQAILVNGKLMGDGLSLQELSNFEVAIGKRGADAFELYYKKLCKRYFPEAGGPPDGVSFKQHFKENILKLLKKIKKWDNRAEISPYDFYEAASGRLEALLLRKGKDFFLEKKYYLRAIQFLYQGVGRQGEDYGLLEKVAFLHAHKKNYTAIEQLVENNPRLPQLTGGGLSLIAFYARYGHVEKVKELLGNDRSISRRDTIPAFQQAVQYGHAQVVKELLSKEGVAQHKNAAFLRAAQSGHAKVVHQLLVSEVGSAISRKDLGEMLKFSANHGHLGVVKELLDQRSHVITELDQRQAFWEAAQGGELEVVRELLNRYPSHLLRGLCKIETGNHVQPIEHGIQLARKNGYLNVVTALQEYLENERSSQHRPNRGQRP